MLDVVARAVLQRPGSAITPPAAPPSQVVRAGRSTPRRIKAQTAAAVVLLAALAIVLIVAVTGLGDGPRRIGQRAGPQIVATSDLYLALNDMDAQVANVLLAGQARDLGGGRDRALRIYQERRERVAEDLRLATAAAGAGAASRGPLRTVGSALGRYDTLTGQAVLLDEQAPHPPGRPPRPALQRYLQASDLMKGTILPAADRLTGANAGALERSYEGRRSGLVTAEVLFGVLGAALPALLVGLQVYLRRRFRRRFNPLLAVVTAGLAFFAIAGFGLLSDESEYLRVAKKDAFDSVLALSRARAIAYDANADQSRFIVDRDHALAHEVAFLDKSQRLVTLQGATIETYDSLYTDAETAYRSSREIRFGGHLGRAFRNITFPGERELAVKTLVAYQLYQLDDRRTRELVKAGELTDAVRFNTGYAVNESNYHFDRFDKALEEWIRLNRTYLDRSVADAEDALRGWIAIAPAAVVLGAALIYLGVRPRLAEYR